MIMIILGVILLIILTVVIYVKKRRDENESLIDALDHIAGLPTRTEILTRGSQRVRLMNAEQCLAWYENVRSKTPQRDRPALFKRAMSMSQICANAVMARYSHDLAQTGL